MSRTTKKKRSGNTLTFNRSLTYSILAHALLLTLSLASIRGCSVGSGKGDDQVPTSNILPKPQDAVQVDLIKVLKEVPAYQVPSHEAQDCANYFGGIGIEFNPLDNGKINRVPEGYPADKAGLKAGMYILNDPTSIRGDVGTMVDVEIKDGIELRTIRMVRDKICLSEVSP
jgi:hypothetical protein